MSVWDKLRQLHQARGAQSIKAMFEQDDSRFDRYSLNFDDMLFDYSKTALDTDILESLFNLARHVGVEDRRDAMFRGDKINETENRAVLHTALRNLNGGLVLVDGKDVMPGVLHTLERMKKFSRRLRNGEITTANDKPFTDVVNIGIGGSDLGPVMTDIALLPYRDGPNCHFISNIDGADITDTLAGLDPATTLVIVASKTFTTTETMTNAKAVKNWLLSVVPADKIGDHLVALSTSEEKTAEFGVTRNRVFGFEDWVGGRYSIWGPIGLSLMLSIGPDDFTEFLLGAEEMDRHFQTAPLAENMPVLLGLIGVWHANLCQYNTRAVLPYDQRLARLPAYLQQLDMESNGKGVNMDGHPLACDSGPIVWGEPGTNGQHAFYQLIHQGTRVIPCEFMIARAGHEPGLSYQHNILIANCLAQSEALMRGRDLQRACKLMRKQGYTGAELERQAAHRVFTGNRPSTTLMYDKLTPRTLGKIIALYEHRVFVEGVIWGINSFDQWGVELGKRLANRLLPLVCGESADDPHDGSTLGLLASLNNEC